MSIFTIKRPVVTEKSMLGVQKGNYTFSVDPAATKGQIKEAVESIFGVNVVEIRTVMIKGKKKRRGSKRSVVTQGKKKKAIVTLKEGQKIALFEVQQ